MILGLPTLPGKCPVSTAIAWVFTDWKTLQIQLACCQTITWKLTAFHFLYCHILFCCTVYY